MGLITSVVQKIKQLTIKPALSVDGFSQIVDEIYRVIPRYQHYNLAQILAASLELRRQAVVADNVEELLVPAYALTYQAVKQVLAITPHREQLLAAVALQAGCLAQMQTGEGKTLAAVFAVYLHALSGRGAQVLTFNEYLAQRDSEVMAPVYQCLGLSCACVLAASQDKQLIYAKDITYLTAKQLGFDFLADSKVFNAEAAVQRPFNFAVVDEADSILIDEACSPLVLASADLSFETSLRQIASMVAGLDSGLHFDTDDSYRNIFLTDRGAFLVQQQLACGDLYAEPQLALLTAVNQGLHAHYLLKRDVHYLIKNQSVKLIDEYTGRVVEDKRWPYGLQNAIEAKEGLPSQQRGKIIDSITMPALIAEYPKLAAMTATAQADEQEFSEVYQLAVVDIPCHRPCLRQDLPDLVFVTFAEKMAELVHQAQLQHNTRRPLLVATASVEESLQIAALFKANKLPCAVLNASNDAQEAELIAKAGCLNAITIATNMAGRGTDIVLGGVNKSQHTAVLALGGLHIIATQKFASSRIDQQLRGRAGRQGDVGSSQFIVCLEDALFQNFLSQSLVFADSGIVSDAKQLRNIAAVQNISQGQSWRLKQDLYRYAKPVNIQRQLMTNWRQSILIDEDCSTYFQHALPEKFVLLSEQLSEFDLERYAKHILLTAIDKVWSDHLVEVNNIKQNIHLCRLGAMQPLPEFNKRLFALYQCSQSLVHEYACEAFLNFNAADDCAEYLAASTWTYVLDDHFFADELLDAMVTDSGTAVAMAAYGGPLLLLWLWLRSIWVNRRLKV